MKSKQLALFLIGFVAIFAFTSQAFAREPVDPSTLNPPPRADTICERVGNGIICDVQFSDPPFAGGSRVICGTGANAYEVSQFLNRSVRGKRYYDQNGNLLRRHFREVLSGNFSNPQNNAAVSFSGQDTHLHYLATPGDVSSGTDIVTGSFRVYLRHGGSVLLEAGRTIEAADGSAFLGESGPHPFADYFVFGDTAAVQPLCDALQ